jgi:hypothetical protein
MDFELKNFEANPISRLKILKDKSLPDKFFDFWSKELIRIQNGFQSWDAQWLYSSWISGAYSISPPEKLTGNIGFDDSGTNTLNVTDAAWIELPGELKNFSHWNVENLKFSEFALKLHNQISFGITAEKSFRSTTLWNQIVESPLRRFVPRILQVYLNRFMKMFTFLR